MSFYGDNYISTGHVILPPPPTPTPIVLPPAIDPAQFPAPFPWALLAIGIVAVTGVAVAYKYYPKTENRPAVKSRQYGTRMLKV